MSKEIFEALKDIEAVSGVPAEVLIEKIKGGILKAVKRDYPDTENVRIDLDPESEKFEMALLKTVVEGEPEDPANEISLDVARTYKPDIAIGDVCEIILDPLEVCGVKNYLADVARTYKPDIAIGDVCEIILDPANFKRVAANSAKQSIRSDIKQFERDRLVEQYKDKEHEIVSATVQKVEPVTGNAVITIDKDEVYFPRVEHLPQDRFRPGDIIKVYVVGIINPDKKPTVKISRTHKDFVKRLFELEVPEIYDGTVEIKAIAREAGSRSKIAVFSTNTDVDAIGSCIGPKRARITAVMEELGGEKIDLIPYSDDDAEFISKALAPAEVISVTLAEDGTKSCKVLVPDNQLSLAIGNKGQNAKLAARLTGYKIDIESDSKKPEPEQAAEA